MTILHTNQNIGQSEKPSRQETLRVAYTPDSDDAFNFYAWEFGRIAMSDPSFYPVFAREHIIALNHAAEQQKYDVLSVSSVAYPKLAENYWILSVGNSVGRGYGPVLVSKEINSLNDLQGKRVAVAGIPTTGGALAMMYCKGATFHEVQYDLIADAIVAGEYDAGVMIHEELLFFPEKGLKKVADLGQTWCEDTKLPLPVGLNLVHKRVGRATAEDISATCRTSLRWALNHYDEAYAYASRFGRGCSEDHISMFSNNDTLQLADDVREAMRIMFDRVAELGLSPVLEDFEVIDE